MSQVRALPSPMRKQIIAKMENEKDKISSHSDNLPNQMRDTRYRQTNVKRMLRLASVKAGVAALLQESGQAISLTQLECLPIEMQLEIANEDSNSYGQTSPIKKNQNGINSGKANRPIEANEKSDAKMDMTKQLIQIGSNHGESEVALYNTRVKHVTPNFFLDNTMPLINYMNENPEADTTAIQQVASFLCTCVAENRLSDTVVLLQNVNRHWNDRWSNNGFDIIFDIVDRHVVQHFRANLDKKWVLHQ